MCADAELLASWIAGDRAAGHTLFTRHFDAVRRFFTNRVNEPEDLIQVTFLACTKGKANFKGDASFKAYLLGIARKVLLKHLRDRHPSRRPIDIDGLSLANLDKRPSSYIAHSQVLNRLLCALRLLALHHQTILELYYWEEMRVRELAETLEVTPKAAESLLYRAKQELGKTMRKLERSEGAPESSNADLKSWAQSVHALLGSPTKTA